MKLTVGQVIRSVREKKNISRVSLAKRLKIHPQYLGHLECGTHVHLSDRIIENLIVILGPSARRLRRLQGLQNKRAKAYRNKYAQ